MAIYRTGGLDAVTAISSALSDATRVRLLAALFQGELCVCQLVMLVELAQSTVSKHLSILRQAGLVKARRDGRFQYFSLAGEESTMLIRGVIAWVGKTLENDPQIAADDAKIREIMAMPLEEICRTGATS